MVEQFVYPAYIGLVVFLTCYAIYRFIILPLIYKPSDLTFDKGMNIIEQIINIELDLYENDIFSMQSTVTNAQYENYISEILEHIESSITPELMKSVSRYMTEDEVYTRIVRLVRRYLDSKVVVGYGELPDEENE